MKLTKDFTLEELTATSTGLPNTPTPEAACRLQALVQHVLQPARLALGMPVKVTSGYRSPGVNKAVGGAANSQHAKGEAADLQCDDNRKLFDVIREKLLFDQLIWEHGTDDQPAWVHVSYKSQGNRKEVLRAVSRGGVTYYERF